VRGAASRGRPHTAALRIASTATDAAAATPAAPDLPAGPSRRGAIFLFLGANAQNALNVAFSLLLARALGPAGFGELVALLALLQQLALPTWALTAIGSRFAAQYAAAGDRPRLRALLLELLRGTLLGGAAAGAGVALAAPALAGFLQAAGPWPVALLGAGLPVVLALPAVRGVLQGAGRFAALAATLAAEGAAKLALAVALAALGTGAAGGVAAAIGGAAAALLLALLPLRDVLARPGTAAGAGAALSPGELARFALLATGATAGLWSLLSLDVLLARHYLDAAAAGRYAALAIAAKMLFWASSAVPGVLYAAVARAAPLASAVARPSGAPGAGARVGPLLLGVGAVSAAALAVFAAWPDRVLALLFGPGYGADAGLLAPLGLAMAFYALANVLVSDFLARAHAPVLAALGAAALVQVGLIVRFHASVGQVALAVLASGAVLLASLAALSLRAGRAAHRQ
jgi:O-antigen/teichoic acid export membrane protein